MPKLCTRDKIYKQAIRLFVKKGFSASVNDLIAAVGIAKGTFYHYFKRKEDLIVELYKTLMFEVERECVTEYCNETAREYSFSVFSEIVKWFITHPEKFNYIVIFETSPYIKKVVGKVDETLQAPLQNTMKKVDMGMLKAYPPEMITFFDFSFTRAAANYFLSFQDPLKCFDEKFKLAFDLYWNGVSQN
ncbi:TetR/AcrR family transcriptional regulator [Marinilabilia rubra]|uniref:TetR/AcrR family transcriptional regulator n=1 Tax=Marinilabilia rubra TaxID=2162893 RepID=A0A2U2B5G8_9BACT|nr:TetR/AcrR family transcriptional regulator [Marinilabilia rubra]PWD98321.1 TetR/AcrR family transcriptional regulator [Marinilabilia rubra]